MNRLPKAGRASKHGDHGSLGWPGIVPAGPGRHCWATGMPELSRGDDCAHVRNQLGVYVLGAIGPGERAQIAEHLAACPWCRGELAGLAGLPGLLRRVPPDVALHAWADDATGPPPGPPLDKLIARVTAARFRRRLIAVAAAVVIAVAVAAGVAAVGRRPPPRAGRPALPRILSTGTAGPADMSQSGHMPHAKKLPLRQIW